MSSFDKGLQIGGDTLHWLLNLIGGVVGFLLPFIAVMVILGVVALILFAIGERLDHE